jgi:Esterase-like activity of phytase
VKVPSVAASYTLPDVPISLAQNTLLPGSVPNDRGLLIGGIGSDLWHGPNDADNEFWMITDRGPNGQIRVDGANRRTFPIPEFTPLIVKVRLNEATGAIDGVTALPIVGQSGKGVTGLSNLNRDEPPYDYSAQVLLDLNQSGIDSEGLVRTQSGEFWVAEEYGPSLLHIDAHGKVLKRYSPQGVLLPNADYPTADTLPAIFEKRKINRGFEGLAISADEKYLFIALQSPLANPNRTIGDASRNTRILVFDITSERVVAEFVYRFEESATFDPSLPNAAEMKISGLIVHGSALLVLERTDNIAKIYSVDLSKATNILGSVWDNAATSPTLESLVDPATAGIHVLPKTLLVNLSVLPNVPGKIEGIAISQNKLVIANDNDFDIGTFVNGVNQGAGVKSKILVLDDVFSSGR